MSRRAVEAGGLSLRLKGRQILGELSLSVERGSFHGIIGPNGAGKTTLFKALVGFLRLSSGSVSLLGESPWPRNPGLLRRVGIQHQRPSFFAKMTLREHLGAVSSLFDADPTHVGSLIETLGLSKVSNTRVENLSGGERQRLAVASALVHKPEILFLDEPTSSLDPASRNSLVELLRDADTLRVTTLYTTHHLSEAELLCDTVSIMNAGQILCTDSPSHLIAEANLGATLLLPAALHQLDLAKSAFASAHITAEGLELCADDAGEAFVTLSRLGVEIAGAQVRNGSLEAVFLAMTGKGTTG